jgi:hypothetical protein
MNPQIPHLGALLALVLLGRPAAAQLTFSVDWKGPSIAQNASVSGLAITEADILTFGPGAPGFGPLPAPAFALAGSNLGLSLYNTCSGHPPGQPCGIEVDAISQGIDELLPVHPAQRSERLWFSTDEWAQGLPLLHPGPTVFTEGSTVGDLSADIFVVIGLGLGPLPPSAGPGQHVAVFDGDGLPSAAPANHQYPGVGLIEPNAPNTSLPNSGDNLDAFDIAPTIGFPAGGYYLSVDSGFLDPLAAVNNSNTAANQGVSGADVLHVAAPSAALAVFAPASALGLDLVGGPGSDDLDALILGENGNGLFEPSAVPYDWVDGQRDMLLFSVRRGSAVIGRPDSIFGLSIEPGDVLTTPRPAAVGGLSPFPGILFAAETLGLRTSRTHGALHGDDIDGLDSSSSPCFDCNNNGVEDAVDIATGSSSDANDNGIPDECEAIDEYCTCEPAAAPCGNDEAGAGCGNSTGAGAHLYFTGTHGVAADDLVLHAEGLPPQRFGLFYMGGGPTLLPFGDGLRCVGERGTGLFRFQPGSSGPAGVLMLGPGVAAYTCAQFPPTGCIVAGSSWNFQCWYRDPSGPCGAGFNTSNGLEVHFGL